MKLKPWQQPIIHSEPHSSMTKAEYERTAATKTGPVSWDNSRHKKMYNSIWSKSTNGLTLAHRTQTDEGDR